jgi:alkaline phosphatase
MLKRSSAILLVALIFVGSMSAAKRPKNVIFLIGDGMGLAQIYSAMVANGNSLELERCQYVGLAKTYSSDNYTTDSAAAGTAMSTGVKTRNGMIGMGPDSVVVETILEQASRNGLATGMVVTCALTHATPAAFIAHQVNRGWNDEIAVDYLKTDIDVFIGGGKRYFDKRSDGRNLVNELKAKDYQIAYTLDDLMSIKEGKVAGLLFDNHPEAMPNRGRYLPEATQKAIDLLRKNKKGFFMMVEASQIDWGGHDNDNNMIVRETLDFDVTVGKVLDFAKKNRKTLVIITADHETGGLTLPSGNIENRYSEAVFSTDGHTGIPVPVFAFGPGAEEFTGFMENTEFKGKIAELLKLK